MKPALVESFQIQPTYRLHDEEAMIFQTPPQRLKRSGLSVERHKIHSIHIINTDL